MNKAAKIGLFLLLTSMNLYASEKQSLEQKTFIESVLPAVIDAKVLETIRYSRIKIRGIFSFKN